MDQADSCRRAAVEAVADVEPPRLHDRIETILDGASMLPGVLTLESAAAIDRDAGAERAVHDARRTDESIATDAVVTHAAGVQLIYEGLRLTRSLSHGEPWIGPDDDAEEGDMAILAADILVARGFYLLARTDAAGKAVRTVQAFGRDQTNRDLAIRGGRDRSSAVTDPERDRVGIGPDREHVDLDSIDANLERDVLELAVLAGAVAVGETPTARLLDVADELAATVGPSFPPAEECLARFESRPDRSLDETPTDRATSATDP